MKQEGSASKVIGLLIIIVISGSYELPLIYYKGKKIIKKNLLTTIFMIRELVNFTQNLDENFKNLGVKPKEGLHILLKLIEEDDTLVLDLKNVQYEIYTKNKKIPEESDFLKKCKFLSLNAWYISTDKCLDLPAKGIQSCSPYSVGFKPDFFNGGGQNVKNKEKNKAAIPKRFVNYFEKVLVLLPNQQNEEKCKIFSNFFIKKEYENLLQQIQEGFSQKRDEIDNQIIRLKNQQAQSKEKIDKENLKIDVSNLELQKNAFRILSDTDYIIFYLDESLEDYKEAHQKYLADKLFNVADYNTKPNEKGEIFGISGFFNSIDSGGNKPFLMHQTATFDISGRISDKEAKFLYEFEQVLPRKILPKPLPIFIFNEELQNEVIGLFKNNDYKVGYKEIIEKLWDKYEADFGNYYLLYYDNTKDGLVFKDFDFVSKFEYELKEENNQVWEISNLFDIREKEHSKDLKIYQKLSNVFDLERLVFNALLSDKYNKLDYFNDLDSASYDKRDFTFLAFSKYRKAVYDYVYKSKRQSIQHTAFSEMVFNGIKDDIKHNRSFGIKEKLNIWFSLYEKFNFNYNPNTQTMASKLKDYQQFVDELAEGKANTEEASAEQFAFAAGQVIDYVLNKSKSENKSYQLLEPYLQHAKCSEFLKSFANDIARYKHEINDFELRFKNVSSFVLSYDTNTNMKTLLPQILAGVFAKSQLWGKPKEKTETK